jgi:putative adhesin
MNSPASRAARLALLAAGAAILSPVGAAAGAQQTSRHRSAYELARLDTTFTFERNGSLSVTIPNGDITITGVEGSQVRIRAPGRGGRLRLDVTGTRARLEQVSGSDDDEDRVEIMVPYGVSVVARTGSGDISIRGTRGEVEVHAQSGDVDISGVNRRLDVHTFSGDLSASDITGDVEIATLNGDVRLTDVRGDADVSSVSGDLDLRGMTAKVVRAKTTSGDVTYDGIVDPAGRYELTSHSGDIRLHIPRTTSAQLSVSTWNGDIDSEFPITLEPGEHGIGSAMAKHFTFAIGGGAARISADTFSGDITISSNGRGARAPAPQP